MALKLWNVLCADMYRYRGKASARDLVAAYLHEPGFRFTYYLRKVKFYSPRKKSLGIFGYVYNRIMLHHYRMRYGFDISPATSIGHGLYIGHFGGVVISPYATLGSNVNIAQGVTIGSTSSGPRQGAPTIGDKVWIGANAVIVGKITIGSGALIGPGAYVYFDVPVNGVVLGNPGIIVGHSGSERYVNRVFGEDTQS
ncbi:serine O-acetyltransferase [Edaphobacter dinghuensis]|uniref:Serine acetyltransferase n=1 Tax=Edaphobacter dinghuensis TaxID=1560005 RepID=A0A917H7I2_9BACT|nr:serine acetyltransferase [Edaphobacter dinghuensis]GGG69928.1 serine acetyltransferase [Edaphobacter dinghuensis]